MTEKDSNYTPSAPKRNTNQRVLLAGVVAIILLTLAGIGIMHYQYTARIDEIHQGGRQFSDLHYADNRYTPTADETEELTEEEYDEDREDMQNPVFQRTETPSETTTATSKAEETVEETAEESHGGAGHLTLRGHIDKDNMLFVLEENENGQLQGQFYNQTINKAVSVEGQHQGKKILLHSTNQGNWDFTIVENGDGYKGVATDGQSTFHLNLH